MTGFVVDNEHVWGRPVGVTVAHDGSLVGNRRRLPPDLAHHLHGKVKARGSFIAGTSFIAETASRSRCRSMRRPETRPFR
jgi:hypothetical protein